MSARSEVGGVVVGWGGGADGSNLEGGGGNYILDTGNCAPHGLKTLSTMQANNTGVLLLSR